MKKTTITMIALLLAMLFVFAACGTTTQVNPEDAMQPGPDAADNTQAPPEGDGEEPQEEEPQTTPSGGAFDAYARPTVYDPESGETFKVAVMIQYVTSPAAQRILNQTHIIADHYGWEVEEVLFEKADNFRDSFQTVMNGGADAIIIHATDALSSREDLLTEAREKGIGIYCVDADLAEGVITNVTCQNGTVATSLFYKMVNDAGGKAMTIGVLNWLSMPYLAERSNVFAAMADSYANTTLLSNDDLSATTYGTSYEAYTTVNAWESQYDLSESVDAVFCVVDDAVPGAVEAIKMSGDTTGENTFALAPEGGDVTWTYLRQNSPLKYVYNQPYDLYAYQICEVIKAIQIDGLNPGDEGCPLEKAGTMIFCEGTISTRENCPQVGDNIHSVFNYYGGDPDDPEAWYNWSSEDYSAWVVNEGETEVDF